MNTICSSLFSPNFTALSSTKLISSPPYTTIRWNKNIRKREIQLPSVASIPYPPINVDYLETEFNGHGVSFASIGDGCVVKMKLDNGSLATIMLPSGLITSYKAPMWHEGLLELLHTVVSEAEGGGVVQGGVSLAFKCQSDEGVSWSPSNWALHGVTGSPEEFIQVELIASNRESMVEVKHIVTLSKDVLSSQLIITNSNTSGIRLMGSIVSHLAVSTPEATYAMGLERSNFFIRPPILSNFSIVPPDFGKAKKTGLGNMWQLFSSWGSKSVEIANDADKMVYEESQEELEGEEDDNNKQLTEEMSRIYTSAPTNFTVLDRGRRNSVVVSREGLNELYIFSPGSNHNSYSKYAYICLGQAALLEPIILAPGREWRAAQHLHNPNL